MFIFLLKDYFKVGQLFKNWETKPVHSAQCRHVVVCTHQIRKRTWESLQKNHLGLGITTISSIKHESYTIQTSHQTSSTSLPGLLPCWSKNYNAAFFLAVCRAPNRVLLCGSWPGVSFGKLLLVVSLQCLQSSIFREGNYW